MADHPVASFEPVKKVVIVGGTHGNERNGVYLAKSFIAQPEQVHRDSFETQVIISNPEAVKKNLRYVDEDLNRCFSLDALAKERSTLECKRAQDIHTLLGPKASDSESKVDMVLDLHNTTANTGVVLMMRPTDILSLQLAAYLQLHDPTVRVCMWTKGVDPAMLPSVAKHGMTVEVGPVSWGCLDAKLYDQTRKLIFLALDFLQSYNVNKGLLKEIPETLDTFGRVGCIQYIRDKDGELISMIPQEIQGGDFTKKLKKGDPLLVGTGLGSPVLLCYEKEESLYPFFVNEAAYYEKNIAFFLCDKFTVKLHDPLP